MIESYFLVTFATPVFYVFAGVEAETAGSSAKKRQKQTNPHLRSIPISVLDLAHPQSSTLVAVDHDGYPGVVCHSRVVCGIGVFDKDEVSFVASLTNRREVAVAFVDGVVLWRNGRVDVPVKLLNIRHYSILTVFHNYYIEQLTPPTKITSIKIPYKVNSVEYNYGVSGV